MGSGFDSKLMKAEDAILDKQKKIQEYKIKLRTATKEKIRLTKVIASLEADLLQLIKHRDYLLTMFGENIERATQITSEVGKFLHESKQVYGNHQKPKEIILLADQLQELVPGMEGELEGRKQRLAYLSGEVISQLKFSYSDFDSFQPIFNLIEHLSPKRKKIVIRNLHQSLKTELLKLPNERTLDSPGIDDGLRIYFDAVNKIYRYYDRKNFENTEAISSYDLKRDLIELQTSVAKRAQRLDTIESLIPQMFYDDGHIVRFMSEFDIYDDIRGKFKPRCKSPKCVKSLLGSNSRKEIEKALQRLLQQKTQAAKNSEELITVIDSHLQIVDKLRIAYKEAKIPFAKVVTENIQLSQELFSTRIRQLLPEAQVKEIEAFYQMRYQRYHPHFKPKSKLGVGEMAEKLKKLSYEGLKLPNQISYLSLVHLAEREQKTVREILEEFPELELKKGVGEDVYALSNEENSLFDRHLSPLVKSKNLDDLSIRLRMTASSYCKDSFCVPHQNKGTGDNSNTIEVYKNALATVMDRHKSIRRDYKKWTKRVVEDFFSVAENHYSGSDLKEIMKTIKFTSFEEAVFFMEEMQKAKRKMILGWLQDTELNNNLGQKKELYKLLHKMKTGNEYWRFLDFNDLVKRFNIDRELDLVDPGRLAELYVKTANGSPSHTKNTVFEYLWDLRGSNLEVRKYLLDPSVISQLSYDVQKRELAMFQLKEKIKLGEDVVHAHGKNHVRKVVRDAKQLIDEQFPIKSYTKKLVLDQFERDLSTTYAENKYLAGSRITAQNWHDSNELLMIDVPSLVSSKMLSDFDRFQVVKYLIGVDKKVPTAVKEAIENEGKWSSENKEEAKRSFDNFVKRFRTGDPPLRTYVLQNFLGEANSLFEEPEMLQQVHDLILGEHKNDLVYRKLFTVYLDSVPANEQRVILSYIMSSFLDSPDGSKNGASIKLVLEAMGPFGIKAGQYLRSSGLVSKKLQGQLDDFYDRALEPTRSYIYRDLQNIFGTGLPGLNKVGALVGSGSLNYGILVHYDTGGVEKRSVVRVQREESFGQIQNENANWKKAIKKLQEDEDEEVRRLAQVLEESRLSSMQTLGKDGSEMDLSLERQMYPDALKAYATKRPHAVSGFTTEVGTPDFELQKKILDEYGKKVSAYEYIPNTRFIDLDLETKKKVSAHIVEAEMDALFKKGIFDPDGHPGNWMIDIEGKRLVRIDYAQMTKIDPSKLEVIRSVVGLLFLPGRVNEKADLIAKNISTIFELGEHSVDFKPILSRVLKDKNFPGFESPHQHLMFIRKELEKHLEAAGVENPRVRLTSEVRAVLGSVSRMLYYKQYLSNDFFKSILENYLKLQFTRADVARYLLTKDGRRALVQSGQNKIRGKLNLEPGERILRIRSLLRLFQGLGCRKSRNLSDPFDESSGADNKKHPDL